MDKEMEAIREELIDLFNVNCPICESWYYNTFKQCRDKSTYPCLLELMLYEKLLSLQAGNLKVGVYEVESKLPDKLLMGAWKHVVYCSERELKNANYHKIREVNEKEEDIKQG